MRCPDLFSFLPFSLLHVRITKCTETASDCFNNSWMNNNSKELVFFIKVRVAPPLMCCCCSARRFTQMIGADLWMLLLIGNETLASCKKSHQSHHLVQFNFIVVSALHIIGSCWDVGNAETSVEALRWWKKHKQANSLYCVIPSNSVHRQRETSHTVLILACCANVSLLKAAMCTLWEWIPLSSLLHSAVLCSALQVVITVKLQ